MVPRPLATLHVERLEMAEFERTHCCVEAIVRDYHAHQDA